MCVPRLRPSSGGANSSRIPVRCNKIEKMYHTRSQAEYFVFWKIAPSVRVKDDRSFFKLWPSTLPNVNYNLPPLINDLPEKSNFIISAARFAQWRIVWAYYIKPEYSLLLSSPRPQVPLSSLSRTQHMLWHIPSTENPPACVCTPAASHFYRFPFWKLEPIFQPHIEKSRQLYIAEGARTLH